MKLNICTLETWHLCISKIWIWETFPFDMFYYMIPILIMQFNSLVVLRKSFNFTSFFFLFFYKKPIICKTISSCSLKHVIDIQSCTSIPGQNIPQVPLVIRSTVRQISEIADWSLMQISLLFADPSVSLTKAKCFPQLSPLCPSTVFSYSTVWVLGSECCTIRGRREMLAQLIFKLCILQCAGVNYHPGMLEWLMRLPWIKHQTCNKLPCFSQIEGFSHGNQANHTQGT